jgi:hypothetical protein
MLDRADKPLDEPLNTSPRMTGDGSRQRLVGIFMRPIVQIALMALVLGGGWLDRYAVASANSSGSTRSARPFHTISLYG